MSHEDEEPTRPSQGSRVDVPYLARYTIPVHALIPVLIGVSWEGREELVGSIVLSVHVAFPVLLIATFQFWRSQIIELVALVAVNHLVTFISTTLLLALLSG